MFHVGFSPVVEEEPVLLAMLDFYHYDLFQSFLSVFLLLHHQDGLQMACFVLQKSP